MKLALKFALIPVFIKKIMPKSLKKLLWFVFKAPQRKFSKGSFYRDLKGLCIYHLSAFLFRKQKLEPITICTGIFNRSDNYLNLFLPSVASCSNKDLISLSVFDCGSNDVENLEQQIKNIWAGDLDYNLKHMPFTRAKSFNRAVKYAKTKYVFLCDADMTIPKDIVLLVNRYVAYKRVWFPKCFFLYKNMNSKQLYKNGEWLNYDATGMVACLKSDFLAIGGLDETYLTWGGEDTDLWKRFHEAQFIVIRNKQRGLLHHWHPSHNPKYQHLNTV